MIENIRTILVCLLVAICVITDIRAYRVYNRWLAVFLLVAVGLNVWDYKCIPEHFVGFLIPLVVGFPLYKLKGIGAGDVKLLGVMGAYIGTSIFQCMLMSVLVAGIMAVGKFVCVQSSEKNYVRRFLSELREVQNSEKISDVRKDLRIHYTIAIAVSLGIIMIGKAGV